MVDTIVACKKLSDRHKYLQGMQGYGSCARIIFQHRYCGLKDWFLCCSFLCTMFECNGQFAPTIHCRSTVVNHLRLLLCPHNTQSGMRRLKIMRKLQESHIFRDCQIEHNLIFIFFKDEIFNCLTFQVIYSMFLFFSFFIFSSFSALGSPSGSRMICFHYCFVGSEVTDEAFVDIQICWC